MIYLIALLILIAGWQNKVLAVEHGAGMAQVEV